MKKTLSLALVMIMAITGVFAKENQTSAAKTVKGKNFTATYVQPSKTEGKLVFGTTEITLAKDCLIGGNKSKLKAGTYELGTSNAGGEWLFTFAKKGASKDVIVRTWALTTHTATPASTLTMTPNAEGLLMVVDDYSVQLPIVFAN